MKRKPSEMSVKVSYQVVTVSLLTECGAHGEMAGLYVMRFCPFLGKVLEKGIVKDSHISLAAPLVMIRKHYGTQHFCVYNRGLNAVTVKHAHLLPRTDDTLDQCSAPLTSHQYTGKCS